MGVSRDGRTSAGSSPVWCSQNRWRPCAPDLTRLSCLQIGFRIEQAMKVDDDIAHFGIVDRPLRAAAPGFFGSLVVGIDPDHVQLVEIDKIQTLGVGPKSAENEKIGSASLRERVCPYV